KNGTTLHLLLNNNTGCSPLPCMGKWLAVPFACFFVVRRGFNDIVSFPLRGKGGLPFFICLYVFHPTGGSHDHYFRIRQSFLSFPYLKLDHPIIFMVFRFRYNCQWEGR